MAILLMTMAGCLDEGCRPSTRPASIADAAGTSPRLRAQNEELVGSDSPRAVVAPVTAIGWGAARLAEPEPIVARDP